MSNMLIKSRRSESLRWILLIILGCLGHRTGRLCHLLRYLKRLSSGSYSEDRTTMQDRISYTTKNCSLQVERYISESAGNTRGAFSVTLGNGKAGKLPEFLSSKASLSMRRLIMPRSTCQKPSSFGDNRQATKGLRVIVRG